MRRFRYLLLPLSLLLCALLAGCAEKPQRTWLRIEGPMLGTACHITAELSSPEADVRRGVMAIDEEAKASMSIFDDNSLLSRLNDNRTDSVDRHIAYNLALAREISEWSGGRYDVTVGPLVEAWGFAGKTGSDDPNVDSILRFVGYEKVRIEGDRLIKEDPRIQLDFNSIAKGYTVDRVAALLDSLGAENYLVEIGGECRARGVNPRGEAWRIGIETPFDGNMTAGAHLTARVRLADAALATSGNYRRFRLDGAGRKIAHTIDPTTGRSAVSTLLSATVVAENCARADALATMFLALGDEAIAAAERMEGAKVYFILDDGAGGYTTYCSEAMRALIPQVHSLRTMNPEPLAR